MLGVHSGDGSLTCIYHWTTERFNNLPQWSISDSDERYLLAFKNTMKAGMIAKTGKHMKSRQYVLRGIKACWKKVIPVFQNKPLPPYKLNQYNSFYLAVKFLMEKRHSSSLKGALLFLKMTYKVSQN